MTTERDDDPALARFMELMHEEVPAGSERTLYRRADWYSLSDGACASIFALARTALGLDTPAETARPPRAS